MNSIGSAWSKWDLHIHTPASYHWNGQRFEGLSPDDCDKLCRSVIDAMNATDVVAFCVMDYWTFEGYITLRKYLERHSDVIAKRIFPGMEMRLVAPVDYKLNTHVLISDEVPLEDLGTFLAHLKLSAPDGKSPTRSNLIEAGRKYDPSKLKEHGYKVEDRANEDRMLELALKTVLVTPDSLRRAMQEVGEENCLLIQPFGTNDGIDDLDWKQHPYTAQNLMSWAHCFETRKQKEVDLFLNRRTPANEAFIDVFQENLGGYPKPCFSGSDAHRPADYGVYPSGRATWLKAQPTFKGLKQVCNEPTLRCHVGDKPEKLRHVDLNPTKYIKSLALSKVAGSTLADEEWFDEKLVFLNSGLIAIIGNKGSGKSALADILALAGNSHCNELEFLNDERFRAGGNKAQHFVATLTWMDGTQVTVNLGADADRNKPERIRYLPQHFIETLCNEIASGNDSNFSKELRKVIFSHVPTEEQLGYGSLDELLDYRIQSRRQAFAQKQSSIFELNGVILRNEAEMSAATIDMYEKALAQKKQELAALDKDPLAEIKKPDDDPNDERTRLLVAKIDEQRTQHGTLTGEIKLLHDERQELTAEEARLTRILGHIENFQAFHSKFVADHTEEFTSSGFDIHEVVAVTVNSEGISARLSEVRFRLDQIAMLLSGIEPTADQPGTAGLESRAEDALAAIAKLQDGLNAPQKAYQSYLREREIREARRAEIVGSAETPETVEFFAERIKRAKGVIPGEVATLKVRRRQLLRELHSELKGIREDYEKLYAAVQRIASDAARSANSIQLEFDASIAIQKFEADFLIYIHRGRTGNFQGDDESKSAVKSLLKAHDFNDSESVVAFTDALLEKLTVLDGAGTQLQIASQLRDRTKVKQLYDFIFGLEYLDIRYMLRLGGKEISQLSPGEKGALLLVFYLLLDTEEIPLIIDQPEHNLDNESVVQLLVDCIRTARSRRQVMIVTHNPNLAVFCDADQVICCRIDKADRHRIEYDTGAIEDYDINKFAVTVLEGTYAAFDNRRRKYQKPIPTYALDPLKIPILGKITG